ncbi:hypothetical protein [Trujillonella humicola]|uniref:hypothetical protein n=1 Tax=Trujillonella humicola TaxID=3383699 RepID=UPI0039064B8C
MIGRPTTEQVLLDCCRVLADVLPEVADETTVVRLVMLEKVLRNAAVRAAHEIAWMREETAAIQAYAGAVEAVTADGALQAALAELAAGPHAGLHLDDVTEVYCRAGDVLSAALEAALAAGREDLVRDGEAVLAARLEHEHRIVGGWDSAGR